MIIHPRSDWGARPATRYTSRSPGSYHGIAVHWFGKPKMSQSHSGCPRLLRAVQRAHMLNKAEGYTDIAYQYAVCPHGHVYELRGIRRQSGANGTPEGNKDFAAIVYMAGEGDPLTLPARKALGELIRYLQSLGVGQAVKPHGFFTGSACPGPALRKWIEDGGYKKKAAPAKKPVLRKPPPALRVDVEAEVWSAKGQRFDNAALMRRIERTLKSGQTVTLKLSD